MKVLFINKGYKKKYEKWFVVHFRFWTKYSGSYIILKKVVAWEEHIK